MRYKNVKKKKEYESFTLKPPRWAPPPPPPFLMLGKTDIARSLRQHPI